MRSITDFLWPLSNIDASDGGISERGHRKKESVMKTRDRVVALGAALGMAGFLAYGYRYRNKPILNDEEANKHFKRSPGRRRFG
jgi:hypothetical protein